MQCTGCLRCPSLQNLSRPGPFGAGISSLAEAQDGMKIYQIFMVPKPTHLRLSTSMQPMDMNWQIGEQPGFAAAFDIPKELRLKLSLETRNRGDVIIVHCQGRIVYR